MRHSLELKGCLRGLLWLSVFVFLLGPFLAYCQDSKAILAPSAPSLVNSPNYLANHPSIAQLNHTVFTEKDGAPTEVTDMFESSDGFLWITSDEGLTRFDGIKFERNLFPGLPHTPLKCVFVDGDGDVWVGMLHGGVAQIHNGKVKLMSGDGLPDGSVFEITRASDGNLWVVTSRGVARRNGDHWAPVTASLGYAPKRPDEVAATEDRSLWINDSESEYTFDVSTRRFLKVSWDQYIRKAMDIPKGIAWLPDPKDNAYSVRDNFNANWVATAKTLDRYRWLSDGTADIEHVTLLSGGAPEGIYKDSEGNIWVWTDKGLDRFRANAITLLPHLGTFSYPAIALNGQGGLWASSWLGPLQKLGTAHPEDASYLSKNVGTIYNALDGTTWWADSKGISSVRQGVVQNYPNNGLFSDAPTRLYQALAVDSSGRLWLSIASYGLFNLDHGHWKRILADEENISKGTPYAIATDPSGGVWLAGPGNGVTLIRGSSHKTYSEQQGLRLGTVLSILFADGHIWVGGNDGVALLDGNVFRTIATTKETRLDGASGLAITKDGDLWVNGLDGLFRIDRSDVNLTLRDPSHINPTKTFDNADGLDGRASQIRPFPTLIASPNGSLWISTSLGVYWVNASAVRQPSVSLHPLITRVYLDDKSVDVLSDVRLPMHADSVQISFTAPYQSAPEHIRFKYRLQGIDRAWQDSGTRREAFYTALPPGSYLFQVVAMLGEASGTEGSAFITLIVPAAWYQTNAAKFALSLLMAVCLVCLFIARSRRDARRAHIRLEERERIARELHDTLLQGTQGLIFQVSRALKLAKDPELRVMLIDAMERAQDSLVDARGRVGELRGEATCWIDLGEAVIATAKIIFLGHSVRFIPRIVGIPRMLDATVGNELLTMCQEAMSNALAHAKCRNVRLEINYSHRYLSITCSDDGQGIAVPVLEEGGREGHWGLTGMRERAALIRARIRVDSVENKGTVIQIKLPGSVAYRHRLFHRRQRKNPK